MTRRIFTVVVLILTLSFAGISQANATTRAAIACKQSGATPTSVKSLIRCVTNHLYVPGGVSKAFYIANRESRFYPRVHNSHSSACGVYQFISSTWRFMVSHYVWGRLLGPVNCENGRMNVFLALRYAHRHGWGPWGL